MEHEATIPFENVKAVALTPEYWPDHFEIEVDGDARQIRVHNQFLDVAPSCRVCGSPPTYTNSETGSGICAACIDG